MSRHLLILLAILCLSCKEEKQAEIIVVDKPEPVKESPSVEFKKIKFSVVCYLCRKWDYSVKDVEILEDSTVYFRKRHNWTIKDSYVAKLDSSDMSKVYSLLSSIDFNAIKAEEFEEEDSPYFSVKFEMYDGEVNMRGSLNVDVWKKILDLLAIIEEQELYINKNRHFSTARDVPPVSSEELKPKNYKKLLDSL